jgi:hypothetical protein
MQNVFTAIVASTILISPSFARDDGRRDDNDRGYQFHSAPARDDGRRDDNDRGYEFHSAPARDDVRRDDNDPWYQFLSPSSHDDWGWGGNNQGGGYHAAPGPVAGAGLPFLAVGYGVYWLVRRGRRKAE